MNNCPSDVLRGNRDTMRQKGSEGERHVREKRDAEQQEEQINRTL